MLNLYASKKIVSYIFLEMFRKTVVMKVLQKNSRKASLVEFLLGNLAFQSTLHNYAENWPPKMFLVSFRRIFESLSWNHFYEVSVVELL